MQMSNGRKALYIVISIVMAIAIWFYLNNDSDVDLTITGIPVEFYNAGSALANSSPARRRSPRTSCSICRAAWSSASIPTMCVLWRT